MNWFGRNGFGFYAAEWLAFALVILFLFALCIALLRLVFWFVKRKRDADEGMDKSESEYWRAHGG